MMANKTPYCIGRANEMIFDNEIRANNHGHPKSTQRYTHPIEFKISTFQFANYTRTQTLTFKKHARDSIFSIGSSFSITIHKQNFPKY